jgi:hypothetical protein
VNDPLYKYDAEVVEVGKSTNFKYRLKWGNTGGPTKEEPPGSLSKRWWCAKRDEIVEKC